jgi:hypothetical protein
MLAVVATMGTNAAVPRTLSHRMKKNKTRIVFLWYIARARRKKSKQVDGTAKM